MRAQSGPQNRAIVSIQPKCEGQYKKDHIRKRDPNPHQEPLRVNRSPKTS